MECVKKMVLVPIGKYSEMIQSKSPSKNVGSDLLNVSQSTVLDSANQNAENNVTPNSANQNAINDMTSDLTNEDSVNSAILDITPSYDSSQSKDNINKGILHQPESSVRETSQPSASKKYRGNIAELLAKFKSKLHKKKNVNSSKRLNQAPKPPTKEKDKTKKISDNKLKQNPSIKWLSL